MSTHDPLSKLASDTGFDINTATRAQLVAHVKALEGLYRVHPAQHALEQLHRYLFPERYADVRTYVWHAGTVEDVAHRIEQALPNAPRAHTAAPRGTR
ncbi:MAG: hypothetical protein ABSG93_09040 [Solirubrobacteraceae bacterium]|jgi:hypothetical protein